MDGQEVNIRDLSGNRTLVVFDTGDEETVQSGDQGIRFLLVTGKPIKEPVAWHGPIVMNTPEELMQAMQDMTLSLRDLLTGWRRREADA